MNFKKLSAPSLKDLFVKELQGMILSGELPVGSRLPSERELAEQMQVSRAVVNGGISELTRQGFLTVSPRQGTFVADYRRFGNIDTLLAIMDFQGGTLGRDELRSLLEVRRALDHITAILAIENAKDTELKKLGEVLDQLARSQTPAEAAENAFHFQHELTLMTKNTILPLLYVSCKTPIKALWVRFCKLYGIDALVSNTQKTFSLICKRDLEGASDWIDCYLAECISGSRQLYDH